jgi:hypothetical protein
MDMLYQECVGMAVACRGIAIWSSNLWGLVFDGQNGNKGENWVDYR